MTTQNVQTALEANMSLLFLGACEEAAANIKRGVTRYADETPEDFEIRREKINGDLLIIEQLAEAAPTKVLDLLVTLAETNPRKAWEAWALSQPGVEVTLAAPDELQTAYNYHLSSLSRVVQRIIKSAARIVLFNEAVGERRAADNHAEDRERGMSKKVVETTYFDNARLFGVGEMRVEQSDAADRDIDQPSARQLFNRVPVQDQIEALEALYQALSQFSLAMQHSISWDVYTPQAPSLYTVARQDDPTQQWSNCTTYAEAREAYRQAQDKKKTTQVQQAQMRVAAMRAVFAVGK